MEKVFHEQVARFLRFPRRGLLILALRITLLAGIKRLFRFRVLRLSGFLEWSTKSFRSFKFTEQWMCSSAEPGFPDPLLIKPSRSFIGYSEHQKALVGDNARYSGVIHDATFRLGPSRAKPPTSVLTSHPPVGGFMVSAYSSLIVKVGPEAEIESGLFCGSLSPHNWYHWIIDTLPAVYLSQFLPKKYITFPLLIPENIFARTHWIESLSLVSFGRPVFPIPTNTYVKVSNLVWVHGATMRGGYPTRSGRLMLEIEKNAMNSYRDQILKQLNLAFRDDRPRSRVFLARSEGSLRPYNQDEIIEIAQKYGFQAMYQEQSQLDGLIEELLHSEYIVGPHGAGWATALFSECAKGALLWTWDEGLEENWFQNVLTVRDIPFSVITTGPGSNARDYWLDPEVFEEEILKMISLKREGN